MFLIRNKSNYKHENIVTIKNQSTHIYSISSGKNDLCHVCICRNINYYSEFFFYLDSGCVWRMTPRSLLSPKRMLCLLSALSLFFPPCRGAVVLQQPKINAAPSSKAFGFGLIIRPVCLLLCSAVFAKIRQYPHVPSWTCAFHSFAAVSDSSKQS